MVIVIMLKISEKTCRMLNSFDRAIFLKKITFFTDNRSQTYLSRAKLIINGHTALSIRTRKTGKYRRPKVVLKDALKCSFQVRSQN